MRQGNCHTTTGLGRQWAWCMHGDRARCAASHAGAHLCKQDGQYARGFTHDPVATMLRLLRLLLLLRAVARAVDNYGSGPRWVGAAAHAAAEGIMRMCTTPACGTTTAPPSHRPPLPLRALCLQGTGSPRGGGGLHATTTTPSQHGAKPASVDDRSSSRTRSGHSRRGAKEQGGDVGGKSGGILSRLRAALWGGPPST